MKTLITSLAILASSVISAQCQVSVPYQRTSNLTYANITGQSFKPTCTAKLKNIVFRVSSIVDDPAFDGYQIGIRIKDSNGNLLGDGIWDNGQILTDDWTRSTTKTADFQCSNITLESTNTYVWEIYLNSSVKYDLFEKSSASLYEGGNTILDGVAENSDLLGWTVNLTTSVENALTATQSQTNPTSATSTDGFASVVVSGGSSSITPTYVWKKEGNVLTNQTFATATNLSVGNYTVDISKGCTITKSFALTTSSLAIDNQQQKTSVLNIYPNPATDKLTINLLFNQNVKIYSAEGKLVITKYLEKGSSNIDVSKLTKGNYIISTSEGSQKFIKQ